MTTRISQLRPHPHIHADDLDGETEVTITGYEFSEAGIEKNICGKLAFKEFDRKLIVNAAKREALKTAFGDVEVESVFGKKVILFPTTSKKPDGTPCEAVGLKIPKG